LKTNTPVAHILPIQLGAAFSYKSPKPGEMAEQLLQYADYALSFCRICFVFLLIFQQQFLSESILNYSLRKYFRKEK
jgi:hypothetical protein